VISAAVVDEERRRFADTLVRVGPDAPTNAGDWTAFDLAAHVVSLDQLGGLPTFVGRALVARGVRLNDLVRDRPVYADRILGRQKRRGFDALVAALRRPSPWLLRRRSLLPVGLFEVWTHHEDVRRRNDLARDDHPDLTEVIAFLRRYGRIDDVPPGEQHDIAYWLAGRDGGPRPV